MAVAVRTAHRTGPVRPVRPRAAAPVVMGILNITPDSFSDGGLFFNPDQAIRQARRMVEDGAGAIDVGGESTRPGSGPVPLEEELRRVIPVVRALTTRFTIPISIDTSKAEVARQALAAGASIVNDVTALRADAQMGRVIAQARAAVILMHMRGTPQTMQQAPRYHDVVAEVRNFLAEASRRAQGAGIRSDRILLDPGLGFGKTVRHNLLLLRRLDALVALGKPVVIGPSRKSFIGRVLVAEVSQRLNGTLACVAYAMRQGAAMVRVHDVKPAVQFIRMWDAIEHAAGRER